MNDTHSIALADLYDHVYDHLSVDTFKEVYRWLAQGQSPSPETVLYDRLARLGVHERMNLLEVGCGQGKHVCTIAKRFGCRVTGIDLSEVGLEAARARATRLNGTQHPEFLQADVCQLPFEQGGFDIVYTHNVLEHIPVLEQAFRSCSRVLKTNGFMLTRSFFSTPLLNADDPFLEPLHHSIHIQKVNMDQQHFEASFTASGLKLVSKEDFSTEWDEYEQEHHSPGDLLLSYARIMRRKETFIDTFGEQIFERTLAWLVGRIYGLLGKVHSVMYTLQKGPEREKAGIV